MPKLAMICAQKPGYNLRIFLVSDSNFVITLNFENGVRLFLPKKLAKKNHPKINYLSECLGNH